MYARQELSVQTHTSILMSHHTLMGLFTEFKQFTARLGSKLSQLVHLRTSKWVSTSIYERCSTCSGEIAGTAVWCLFMAGDHLLEVSISRGPSVFVTAVHTILM